MKITIVGNDRKSVINAWFFSQSNETVLYTDNPVLLNPPSDGLSADLFKVLSRITVVNHDEAFDEADMVLICTQSVYDATRGGFDTSYIESIAEKAVNLSKEPMIAVKSTVYPGFTEHLIEKFDYQKIVYMPDLFFGKICKTTVIGCRTAEDEMIGEIKKALPGENTELFMLSYREAETAKLFYSSYHAMLSAFFNELDSFCGEIGLNSRNVLRAFELGEPKEEHCGISLGLNGYAALSDAKQLKITMEKTPSKLIKAITDANNERLDYIADQICNLTKGIVGIYRILDGFGIQIPSVIGIMERLSGRGVTVILYDPVFQGDSWGGCVAEKDFESFKARSDVIVAVQDDKNLEDVKTKVFTR